MTDEFKDPSEKAVLGESHLFRRKHEFPFDRVPVGKSFAVPKELINSTALRSAASRAGKVHSKIFRVIDHGDTFEVYCAGVRESEKVEKPNPLAGIDPNIMAEVEEKTNQIKPLWGRGEQ